MPALILWGEDDPFAPVAGAHRLAAEIPDSRVEVLPGTGHFIFDEAPEQATASVLEFLATLGVGRRGVRRRLGVGAAGEGCAPRPHGSNVGQAPMGHKPTFGAPGAL